MLYITMHKLIYIDNFILCQNHIVNYFQKWIIKYWIRNHVYRNILYQ